MIARRSRLPMHPLVAPCGIDEIFIRWGPGVVARTADDGGATVLDTRVVSGSGRRARTRPSSTRPASSARPGTGCSAPTCTRRATPASSSSDAGPRRWRAPCCRSPTAAPGTGACVRGCSRSAAASGSPIWHGHDYKSNALGLLLRRFWPMRLVTTVHGWVQQTRRTPLYYRIDRLCLPRYERVICVSDDLSGPSASPAGCPRIAAC